MLGMQLGHTMYPNCAGANTKKEDKECSRMTPEQYRKYITEMITRILDEKSLKRIYDYTHKQFINTTTKSID